MNHPPIPTSSDSDFQFGPDGEALFKWISGDVPVASIAINEHKLRRYCTNAAVRWYMEEYLFSEDEPDAAKDIAIQWLNWEFEE
jgi:hypothetical protein